MVFLLSLAGGVAVSVAAALVGERRGAGAAHGVARGALVTVSFHVGLFAAMLAGIVAHYFWVHGTAGPIDLDGLWRPVLVSPIIFMPVYVAATRQPRGLIPPR